MIETGSLCVAGLGALALSAALAIGACSSANGGGRGDSKEAVPPVTSLEKTPEQWRGQLPTEVFGILFADDTEPPFTSPLNGEKREGTYLCAACFLPLFTSAEKYDSGTGWPSFRDPIPGRLGTRQDFKLLLPRTEYHCQRCGGHQGHVFGDGPPPGGRRWCNNGLALRFVPAGETLPALRD